MDIRNYFGAGKGSATEGDDTVGRSTKSGAKKTKKKSAHGTPAQPSQPTVHEQAVSSPRRSPRREPALAGTPPRRKPSHKKEQCSPVADLESVISSSSPLSGRVSASPTAPHVAPPWAPPPPIVSPGPPSAKRKIVVQPAVVGVAVSTVPAAALGNDSDEEGGTSSGLSDYEKARLENIRTNQARLAELGLGAPRSLAPSSPPASGTKPKKVKRKAQPKVPLPAERRSKRARGEKPDYTAEKIDQFGDELDVAAGRSRAPKAVRTVDEIVGDARELLLKSRAALLQCSAKPANMVVAEKDGWFKQAVHLWGPRVAEAQPPSWEAYVQSRVSRTPPAESPYLLLQEFFAADTWKLLISCVLMSRVSSTETKTRCIGGFFQAYPTPSDAIMANPSDVLPIISGLGLFETRWRAVVAITQRFLEMPEFRVGLDKEHKVYGLGEFGIDSYLIFTQYPAGCDMTPADKNLRAYCGWLKSSLAGGAVKTEPQVKVEPGIKVE